MEDVPKRSKLRWQQLCKIYLPTIFENNRHLIAVDNKSEQPELSDAGSVSDVFAEYHNVKFLRVANPPDRDKPNEIESYEMCKFTSLHRKVVAAIREKMQIPDQLFDEDVDNLLTNDTAGPRLCRKKRIIDDDETDDRDIVFDMSPIVKEGPDRTENDYLTGIWNQMEDERCKTKFETSPLNHDFYNAKTLPDWIKDYGVPYLVLQDSQDKCLKWIQQWKDFDVFE